MEELVDEDDKVLSSIRATIFFTYTEGRPYYLSCFDEKCNKKVVEEGSGFYC